MPEPQAAVLSNNLPTLIDGELRVGRVQEELCKLLVFVRSPLDTGTHRSLAWVDRSIEVLPEELVLEIFSISTSWPTKVNGKGDGMSLLMCVNNGIPSYLPRNTD
jgi:hypothetical protein